MILFHTNFVYICLHILFDLLVPWPLLGHCSLARGSFARAQGNFKVLLLLNIITNMLMTHWQQYILYVGLYVKCRDCRFAKCLTGKNKLCLSDEILCNLIPYSGVITCLFSLWRRQNYERGGCVHNGQYTQRTPSFCQREKTNIPSITLCTYPAITLGRMGAVYEAAHLNEPSTFTCISICKWALVWFIRYVLYILKENKCRRWGGGAISMVDWV